MIAIMGITGNVGGAIADHLLTAGRKVRGLTRDLKKAKAWADRGVELVETGFDDAAGLTKAFSGAEGVFAMIPPDFAPPPGFPGAPPGGVPPSMGRGGFPPGGPPPGFGGR